MKKRVLLIGDSALLTGALKATVEDCGFDALVEKDRNAVKKHAGDLFIFEVREDGDLDRIKGRAFAGPFIIFTSLEMRDWQASLKEQGLIGVITAGSYPEDISFLLNKAMFYEKMLKRNPRAQVNIPVELKVEARTIKTNATLLSRDGMFIVTLHPFSANTVCGLKFRIPGVEDGFETEARVIYNIAINKDLSIISDPKDPFKRLVSHPGMAVFFTDLPEKDRVLIDGYVRGLE